MWLNRLSQFYSIYCAAKKITFWSIKIFKRSQISPKIIEWSWCNLHTYCITYKIVYKFQDDTSSRSQEIIIWKKAYSRQLPQRAAREPQIVLSLTHVYDTKMYLKKLFDKRFRRIFSSAFQWCRQFFGNFRFWPSKTLWHSIPRRKPLGHSLENILSYVKNAQLSI